MRALEAGSRFPNFIRLANGATVPSAPRMVAGIEFPNPVGLAAGLDKNGEALTAGNPHRLYLSHSIH